MKKAKLTSLVFILLTTIFSCKEKIEEEATSPKKLPTFNYLPPKPINGKLLGVVELGAAGFNSFIINIDKNLNWELKDKSFGTSLIVEGMTNTALVDEKLVSYIDKISAYGLAKKDIHFVVSSGAAKEEITQLISLELKKLGYDVNNVSAKKEGFYALKANLPKDFRDNSFLVDMGSGNTKISYFNKNGEPVTFETHGAKYYQKGLEDKDIYDNVREVIAKVPESKRTKCFIIGGVPTKLARFIHPEEETYTLLNTNATYFKVLSKKEGKKVKSGLNIYKAILEETKVPQVIYASDGNFTIGFLLEKIK